MMPARTGSGTACKAVERNRSAIDARAGRSDDSRYEPRVAQDRLEQVRGRRLPVGPGHRDGGQLGSRIAEHESRDRPHRSPHRSNDDLRHVGRQPALDDDGARAGRDGARGEVVTVDRSAWDTEEQVSRNDVPVVERGAVDDRAGVALDLAAGGGRESADGDRREGPIHRSR